MLSILAALCPIAMMTFTSPDLDAVQDRYQRYLHYELRAEGVISQELAESWEASNVAGRRYILLGPASGVRRKNLSARHRGAEDARLRASEVLWLDHSGDRRARRLHVVRRHSKARPLSKRHQTGSSSSISQTTW